MEVVFTPKAIKQFKKLDTEIQRRIKKLILEIQELENPRLRGKGLGANLSGFWRYRVGDYRLICKISDEELIILIVDINHRREVYTVF